MLLGFTLDHAAGIRRPTVATLGAICSSIGLALTRLGFVIAWRMDQHAGLSRHHERGADADVAVVRRVFSARRDNWVGWIMRANPLTYAVAGCGGCCTWRRPTRSARPRCLPICRRVDVRVVTLLFVVCDVLARLASVGTADDGGFVMKSAVLAFWIAILATRPWATAAWWAYQQMAARRIRSITELGRTYPSPPQTLLELAASRSSRLTERSGKAFDTEDARRARSGSSASSTPAAPGPACSRTRPCRRSQKELADRDVRFVEHHLRPGRRHPDQLREYAARFNADPEQWLFLTGSSDTIQDIAHKQFCCRLHSRPTPSGRS